MEEIGGKYMYTKHYISVHSILHVQLSANGVSVPAMASSQWPPVHVPHAMPQHTTSNTSSTYRALSYAQGSSRQRILRATGRPLAARCSTREQQGHSTMWPRLRGSVVSQAPLWYCILYFH